MNTQETSPDDLPERLFFIPKSSNDTAIEDRDQRIAAIAKRRAEHDISALNVQVCFYLLPEEIEQVPEAIRAKHFDQKQPLYGAIFSFTPEQLEQSQSTWISALPEPLKAKFMQGTGLPKDLSGYGFFVAPVPPRVDDNPKQFQRGDRMVLNGDGLIYRLGFEGGQAALKTRLMKPPCYYVDLAIQLKSDYDVIGFRFLDGGMVRHSLSWGTRNQVNTAFLVTPAHLIVTFDGARPHLIDPDSLEVLDTVGAVQEWRSLAPSFIPKPFQQIFLPYSNPAHPVCDHTSPEQDTACYTVNFSQGWSLLRAVDVVRLWLKQKLGNSGDVLREAWGGFTNLVRYRGPGQPMQQWQLVLPSGEPVVIEQSIHQMALTQDYILLGDIAFEIELSQIFGPFVFGYLLLYLRNLSLRLGKFPRFVGHLISLIFFRLVPPQPFANLYLIKRADIRKAEQDERITTLPAIKITLPREVSHFVVDYENPDHIITLHSAHNVGWDVTEWIGEFDESVNPALDPKSWGKAISRGIERTLQRPVGVNPQIARKALRQKDLRGTQSSPVDLNFMARYRIDGRDGTLLNMGYVSDPGNREDGRNTWAVSVNTYRNLARDQQTESGQTIKNLYWMSWGFSWEMIPRRVYLAYKDRDVRTLPAEALPADDKPMTLLHLNTETVDIAQSFEFPIGCFARSPQFIPSSVSCPPEQDPTTHGYIACVVMADDEQYHAQDEFWVFSADDFKGKPFYRLSHPDVSLGFTIHSTWLPPERVEQAKTLYPAEVRQEMRSNYLKRDYDDLIENHKPQRVKALYHLIQEEFIQQVPEHQIRASAQKIDSVSELL